MNTPVLFIVFNRPDTTERVFEAIRKAKPKQLFVAADGPRPNKEGEHELCDAVRKISTSIDWDCEIKTLFRKDNLGCKVAVSEAINWFFNEVEEGIILEDDCLPNESFFVYCEAMLRRYRYNEKVMHIGGINFDFFHEVNSKNSHFLTEIAHVWGWATWRRAWLNYDIRMPNFINWTVNDNNKMFFREVFELTYQGKIDTWDYQWIFCLFWLGGLAVVPQRNLIKNIGFDTTATHTISKPFWIKLLKYGAFNISTDKNGKYARKYIEVVINNTIKLKYSFFKKVIVKIYNVVN